MRIGKQRGSQRWGGAAVETAFVLIPMFMFLCGVFEYGRLLMDWELLNNAAREGCRYALANNTSPTINTDVQNIVLARMAGRSADFGNFTVTVSGTRQGVSTPVSNLGPGDLVTVTVSGQYQLLNITPLTRKLSSFTMSSSVTMVCEGGT
jgi:Flp pilus assembly protein TadG